MENFAIDENMLDISLGMMRMDKNHHVMEGNTNTGIKVLVVANQNGLGKLIPINLRHIVQGDTLVNPGERYELVG